LVAGLASSSVLCGAAFASSTSNSVSLPTVLATQIAKAKHSGVDVLIPSRIDAGLPASHLYGSGGADSGGYDIQLAALPHCDDANACFVAEFWGGPGKLNLGSPVSLSKGISARFHASTCGASCAPAQIEWLEFGSRYTIQFTGSRVTLVSLADSAIAAGPR
jgi:hypothetical protein